MRNKSRSLGCARDDHLYELAAEDLQVGRQEGEKNHGTSAGALVRFADPEHTRRWVTCLALRMHRSSCTGLAWVRSEQGAQQSGWYTLHSIIRIMSAWDCRIFAMDGKRGNGDPADITTLLQQI